MDKRVIRIWKWEVAHAHIETVVILKIIVAVGILSALFLPSHIASVVGAGTNLLWLWRL